MSSSNAGTVTVAFLGLGSMGSAMASNILKHGYKVLVWNRTASKSKNLVAAGAKAVATPREAGEHAKIIISCLFDDKACLETVQGPNGLLSGMKKGSIHVNTSTVSPMMAKQLAQLHKEKDVHYIAGPILGRPDVAAAGKLKTYLAGQKEAIDAATPIIECYGGGGITIVGEDPPQANVIKLTLNFCWATTIDLFGQVYSLNEKWNVPEKVTKSVLDLLFPFPAMVTYGEKVRTHDYDVANEGGFRLPGGLKDMKTLIAAGEEVGVPLPFANVIQEHICTAVAHGMTDKDWYCFAESTRFNSGITSKHASKHH